MSVSGDIANNGVLDLTTWIGTLPADMVNNGSILSPPGPEIFANWQSGIWPGNSDLNTIARRQRRGGRIKGPSLRHARACWKSRPLCQGNASDRLVGWRRLSFRPALRTRGRRFRHGRQPRRLSGGGRSDSAVARREKMAASDFQSITDEASLSLIAAGARGKVVAFDLKAHGVARSKPYPDGFTQSFDCEGNIAVNCKFGFEFVTVLPHQGRIENNVAVRCETPFKWSEVRDGKIVPSASYATGANKIYQDDPGFTNSLALDFSLRKDARLLVELPEFSKIRFEEIGLRAHETQSRPGWQDWPGRTRRVHCPPPLNRCGIPVIQTPLPNLGRRSGDTCQFPEARCS